MKSRRDPAPTMVDRDLPVIARDSRSTMTRRGGSSALPGVDADQRGPVRLDRETRRYDCAADQRIGMGGQAVARGKTHKLGFANGKLIEHENGTVEYTPSGKWLPVFEVNVQDSRASRCASRRAKT